MSEAYINSTELGSEINKILDILIEEKNIPELQEILNFTKIRVEEVLVLPLEAPELFKNRKNKKETATDFLRRVRGKYIDAGVLSRPDLKSFKNID